MTQADLIAALPDGRLPPGLTALGPLDLLALFGAGLVAAGLLSLLIAPFLGRRPSRKALIRATRTLPPQERLLAVARILGHLPEVLRPAAYGREEPPPGKTIERIALNSRGARAGKADR
jgi:hypothetical protein